MWYPYRNFPGETSPISRVWNPNRFTLPIRQFSNPLDLRYVHILGTFLSYKSSLLRSFWSPELHFDLPRNASKVSRGNFFQGIFFPGDHSRCIEDARCCTNMICYYVVLYGPRWFMLLHIKVLYNNDSVYEIWPVSHELDLDERANHSPPAENRFLIQTSEDVSENKFTNHRYWKPGQKPYNVIKVIVMQFWEIEGQPIGGTPRSDSLEPMVIRSHLVQ